MEQPVELCSNCNAELKGPFCHSCGQSSRSMIKFFGEVLKELFDDIAGYDSRFRKSILPLLFKPGQLTQDYISGKRFSYVAPFRLFLLTSVVLIVLMKLVTSDLKIEQEDKNIAQQLALKEIDKELANTDLTPKQREKLEEAKKALFSSEENNPKSQDSVDTFRSELQAEIEAERKIELEEDNKNEKDVGASDILPSDNHGDAEGDNLSESTKSSKSKKNTLNFNVKEDDGKPGYFNFTITDDGESDFKGQAFRDYPFLKEFILGIAKKQKAWQTDPKPLVHAIFELLPYMLLIIIPIFAVFYKLIYMFKKRYFIEHLVFNIHTHCFLFLIIILQIALDYGITYVEQFNLAFFSLLNGIVSVVLTLSVIWIPVYYVLAIKRVYKQGWFWSISKSLVLSIIYLMLMSIGLIVTSLVGAWQA